MRCSPSHQCYCILAVVYLGGCVFVVRDYFSNVVIVKEVGVDPKCQGKEMSPVEKRLQQSNENWLRSLESRRKLEEEHPLDKFDQWSFKGIISFWDFFYPSFDCPHTSERIGRAGDGGKWICGFSEISERSKSQPCVVYSYGVSNEFSFDQEILERSNCTVYMFDPFMDSTKVPLPQKYPNRVFLEKIALGIEDTMESRTLESQMKKNGHTFIDILKLDIEDAEFEILIRLATKFPHGPPFGQLAVELHLPSEPRPYLYALLKVWMDAMERMGLRPFRNEINLAVVKYSERHTPNCAEYSFINVKYDNYLLHSNT